MSLFAFFFLMGVSVTLQLPELPQVWIPLLLTASAALAGVCGRCRNPGIRRWAWPIAVMLLAAGLGVVLATNTVQGELQRQLAPQFLDENLVVTGRITGIPVNNPEQSRFDFRITDAGSVLAGRPQAVFSPVNLRLRWYGTTRKLVPGQRWRLVVRLKRPRSFSNPGSFDYAGWLFQKRIHATGYVVWSPDNKMLGEQRDIQSSSRIMLAKRIEEQAPSASHRGLMQGLLVGIRHQIPSDTWNILRATGTSHLLAISGLHIGMLASWGFLLGSLLWRAFCCTSIVRWRSFSRSDCATFVAGGCALGYAWLAGFTLPTQRALIMLIVLMFFRLARRHSGHLMPLSLALVLILIIDPLAPLSAGFWLSFSAVIFILALNCGRASEPGGWLSALRLHLALGMLLFPLTSLFFSQSSLIAPLANLIAIPFVSFLVVPLLMLWLLLDPVWPYAAVYLLEWVDGSLTLFMAGLQLLTVWLPADVMLPESGWLTHMALLLGAALLLMPLPILHRWLVLPMCLSFIWSYIHPASNSALSVDVLDVGGGLSVLVRTPGHTLLYGTGAADSKRSTMASIVVRPFLQSQGIRRLDKIVLPQIDIADAREQLQALTETGSRLTMGKILAASEVLAPEMASWDRNLTSCHSGRSWVWDDVRFRFLYPDDHENGNPGNASCILLIQWHETSILLADSLDQVSESRLLDSLRGTKWLDVPTAVTLMVAPDHGSELSSSDAFLDRFSPESVVYSVGYENRSGYPHEMVQMRYKLRGARQYRTDYDGALRFGFSETGLDAETARHRSSRRRLWHWGENPD